jgi:hypothetical protein
VTHEPSCQVAIRLPPRRREAFSEKNVCIEKGTFRSWVRFYNELRAAACNSSSPLGSFASVNAVQGSCGRVTVGTLHEVIYLDVSFDH